jgi:glycosyltransferase involved in cell wall biosynthesis
MSDIVARSPRVAVIVPAYGVAHLVGEALASLLAQSFSEWECVVIDDGAPDDVASAVAPFLTDPRIRFVASDNRGVATARNRAIEASTAPLIALLDGDDVLSPGYLKAAVTVLEADPSVRLFTANSRVFGAVPIERPCFDQPQPEGTLANVLDRSFGVHIASTFHRADWQAVGGFDADLTLCEDFDLWVQLLILGGRAHYCDAVLSKYRVRPGSATANVGRMLLGNIEVYEKARATLPADAPEQQQIERLIGENREALAFEHAIDRVIDGDTARGLAEIKQLRGRVAGPAWSLSFAVWRLVPALARPLLRWRRKQHSRGFAPKSLRELLLKAPS